MVFLALVYQHKTINKLRGDVQKKGGSRLVWTYAWKLGSVTKSTTFFGTSRLIQKVIIESFYIYHHEGPNKN